MDAEIGHFALIIALCLAIAQSIIPLVGAYRNNLSWRGWLNDRDDGDSRDDVDTTIDVIVKS